jgi:phospho-2-dehydro-3-deoxyheptonate aldolase
MIVFAIPILLRTDSKARTKECINSSHRADNLLTVRESPDTRKRKVQGAQSREKNLCNEFKNIVKGFMIESFLVEGNQAHDEIFGKSITDPCLGWEDTERLLCNIAEQV